MANLVEMISAAVQEYVTKYLRPVAHADVVIQDKPVWVRAAGAEFYFGIKRDFLNQFVAKGKVIAKKADRVVVYKYADIDAAMNNLPNLIK